MPPITLQVNGRSHQIDADPEMPLLWALRDSLGLVGTKFGCGGGFCGACTVHVDGAATRSCTLPLGKTAGRAIVTIEGLAAGGDGCGPIPAAAGPDWANDSGCGRAGHGTRPRYVGRVAQRVTHRSTAPTYWRRWR